MQRILVLLAGVVLATAQGCGQGLGELAPPQPPKVTVAAPLVREVRDFDEYTGRVEAEQMVEVRSRVSGYLQEVYFQDGDYVEPGQPLFLIDPRTYKAEFDQAKAKINLYDAKYKYAKSVRARSEKLVTNNSVTREEYEQNLAAENEALAAKESAQADTETNRLNLEFTTIHAEIGGRIDRTLITKGNLVQSGPGATLLTRIVSVDPIFVYFNPDELAFLRYMGRRIADDGKAEAQHVKSRGIEATIILADGSTYPQKGTVDFAANRVDPSTGTIQVRAVFPNERRALTPGLFVRLRIAAEQAYSAVLVPERSINTDQSEKFVYVVDDQSTAQRRNVLLGTKHGRLRAIKQGLAAGDQVVISGGLLVRPGQKVTPTTGVIEDSESLAVTQYKPLAAPQAAPAAKKTADSAQSAPVRRPSVER